MLEDNAQAKDQYAALGLDPKEFIKVKSGNLTLDAWMIKPVDFDASKKYPVIIEVYGEPGERHRTKMYRGNGDLWQQYMANQGYIVVSIESSGSRILPVDVEDGGNVFTGKWCTLASEGPEQGYSGYDPSISVYRCRRDRYVPGWSGGGSLRDLKLHVAVIRKYSILV